MNTKRCIRKAHEERRCRLDVDTRYLGHAQEKRDFNYVVHQRGQRTTCNLNANGVLAGESQKTLRGTIELVRGCKGSVVSKQETVLLADERVVNRTVPVILCTENPIAAMAWRVHTHGSFMVVDGAQSVSHMPVNMQALGCDFFAFSAHKALDPFGVGVLWGKLGLLEAKPPALSAPPPSSPGAPSSTCWMNS